MKRFTSPMKQSSLVLYRSICLSYESMAFNDTAVYLYTSITGHVPPPSQVQEASKFLSFSGESIDSYQTTEVSIIHLTQAFWNITCLVENIVFNLLDAFG